MLFRGMILFPNHVTWLTGLALTTLSQDPILESSMVAWCQKELSREDKVELHDLL